MIASACLGGIYLRSVDRSRQQMHVTKPCICVASSLTGYDFAILATLDTRAHRSTPHYPDRPDIDPDIDPTCGVVLPWL